MSQSAFGDFEVIVHYFVLYICNVFFFYNCAALNVINNLFCSQFQFECVLTGIFEFVMPRRHYVIGY